MSAQTCQLETPEPSPSGSPRSSPLHSTEDKTRHWEYPANGFYPITPPTEACESDEELCGTVASSIHLEADADAEVESEADADADVDAHTLVAVLGVGYVGEHLVSNFARKYGVLGFDVSETRVQHLREAFGPDTKAKFTCNPRDLAEATHFLVSVPTLLRPDQSIDSSFLQSAIQNIATHARPGAVIVIESSVAVGMTRALLGPLAQERGFFAGMSPERVDPGRAEPPANAIPKIVSGLDDVAPGSLDAITRLYEQVFDRVVPVSRPEVAEMTKLYENCQRMMCVAFANEMADACVPHGVDPYEVCRAASTKPFGYMPFTPSLGVGGHCIPVNPYYLLSNSHFPLLQAATERMRARPAAIAQRAILCVSPPLPLSHQPPPKPRILVVGMGFKRGQSHLANSPGLELAKTLLASRKVGVAWADPLVKQEAIPQIEKLDDRRHWTAEALRQRFHRVIVAFRQEGLDFSVLEELASEGGEVQVEMWCP
ncbi:nucleotide sugar dehydrogenase [Sodiomyces alkalinus F11]|uniref:Nucleotide sugar dehydrogenase n=1 Tax=Sodiomyces alkalinus (strain CBS 110278 / VKM F-3762 / F11) TaxID=1314773 RepID=A0A3N2PUD1_SODAK|nr:nucleotide sugar dehydrogenase [Sodiomyces alkalinus F11]ROT38091.1 nucleotide sugar dehydrogenase [Sodiomyces alkalinus F11]